VAKLTAEECMALGLNKNFLMCSSCDALKEFSLDSLESECKSCCEEDDVNATPTKYPRALLEVCG
jgi:anaerobic ribonucleoside-triphosphate reductase